MVTTKKKSTVKRSVRTGKSVKLSLKKKTPFRHGSIREMAFLFLLEPRTIPELGKFVQGKGLIRIPGLLRLFRKGIWDNGYMWLLTEVAHSKIQLRRERIIGGV